MQRMSGVATQTAVYVKRLEGLRTKVLDTRKTTPGMRVLEVGTGSGYQAAVLAAMGLLVLGGLFAGKYRAIFLATVLLEREERKTEN